jgi:hypothetical protein
MSLDLQKQIWDDPEPRGNAKYVLVHLASYVKHDAWRNGDDLLAWPSQNTVAAKCCIARSTVEKAFADLEALGKIRDTGRRKGRRTVVWELYPSTAPEVQSGADLAADLPAYRASGLGDLPGSEASNGDLPEGRAGELSTGPDLPGSRQDLPGSHGDLPGSEASTCPPTGHEQRRESRTTNTEGEMRARAGARNQGEGEDLSEELAEVEELLGRRPADRLLNERRDEILAATGGAA